MEISSSMLDMIFSDRLIAPRFQKNFHYVKTNLQNIERKKQKMLVPTNLETIITELLLQGYKNKKEVKSIFNSLEIWIDFFVEILEDKYFLCEVLDAFLFQIFNNFNLLTLNKSHQITAQKFLKLIFETNKKNEFSSGFEIRYLIQTSVFYSLFHKDFNIPLKSIQNFKINNINTLFDELFVKEIDPVLLIDNFQNLRSIQEFEVLAKILLENNAMNNSILEDKISKSEFSILTSSNHPILNHCDLTFDSLLNLVKFLNQLKLNSNLIYRLFQFKPNLSANFIPDINSYTSNVNSNPTFKELQKLIDFLTSRPNKYLFGEKTNYLFKKEMSTFFKDDFSRFVDYCESENCESNKDLIYVEWSNYSITRHSSICKKCLNDLEFEYFSKYDSPF